MNSKILKEYKEKYDKLKKKEDGEEKKCVFSEEKSISTVFEKYTDRPDESIEKSLFEYGILRNPESDTTIIGIEKSGDKFVEFIFDYISQEEIIDEINRIDNSFFNKLESVVGSKEELLQAVISNENDIAVIILLLIGHRDNKISDMIENNKGTSIDLETLIDMIENEVDIKKDEKYEYDFNSDGEIVEVKKANKELDIFPESKNIDINVIDEMAGYKVVYKDENGKCRLFNICENKRVAEKVVKQVFENIKNRKHDSGAGLYIYTPYDFNGSKVKKITESNYISLKEEFDRELKEEDNDEDLNEGCWLVAEAREGSDTLKELYELLGKDINDISPLLETSEDFEKALNYLKQWDYGDAEKEYEPYYDVLKYFKGNYEEIDGYIIGETPYGDVLVYAKGERTID